MRPSGAYTAAAAGARSYSTTMPRPTSSTAQQRGPPLPAPSTMRPAPSTTQQLDTFVLATQRLDRVPDVASSSSVCDPRCGARASPGDARLRHDISGRRRGSRHLLGERRNDPVYPCSDAMMQSPPSAQLSLDAEGGAATSSSRRL